MRLPAWASVGNNLVQSLFQTIGQEAKPGVIAVLSESGSPAIEKARSSEIF